MEDASFAEAPDVINAVKHDLGGINLSEKMPWNSEGLSYQNVIEILRVVKESNWGDIEIEISGSILKVSRSSTFEAGIAEPRVSNIDPVPKVFAPEDVMVRVSSEVETPDLNTREVDLDFDGVVKVTPPMAGIFYSAPSPGADDFVVIGADVIKNQQVGIVEVMKLFTPVLAPSQGRICDILAVNGEFVQNEQVIMTIESSGEVNV